MTTFQEISKKHKAKLSIFQAKKFEEIMKEGLTVYARSAITGQPFNSLEHNLAFVVVQSEFDHRFFRSCAKLPKSTIQALVKKGVLKRIEVHINWEIHGVWIVDGFGMTSDQFGNSWLKLEGIDPNSDLKEQRETRQKLIKEINGHFQK